MKVDGDTDDVFTPKTENQSEATADDSTARNDSHSGEISGEDAECKNELEQQGNMQLESTDGAVSTQNPSGQDSSGKDPSGQDLSGQDPSGQVPSDSSNDMNTPNTSADHETAIL